MSARMKMCIVNPLLLDDLASRAGSQAHIMLRIGISWNSWIKISAGLPVRCSVGERLKARILDQVEAMPGLRSKFPSDVHPNGIDMKALDAAFLFPVDVFEAMDAQNGFTPRSVQRAKQMLGSRGEAYQQFVGR